jgi:hypothetical protein
MNTPGAQPTGGICSNPLQISFFVQAADNTRGRLTQIVATRRDNSLHYLII